MKIDIEIIITDFDSIHNVFRLQVKVRVLFGPSLLGRTVMTDYPHATYVVGPAAEELQILHPKI